ncbi:hypothetical protein DDE83_007014 [Stemphylium lycopersici]|uniref:Uncharacterized protein n=1 Tax=Stemphylium lycopersici TaxID=183478 RepID=A0A364MX78_STELY|nr:hypothetical protein DDE83_007014 [Stemphylium lycopersici]
MSLRRALAPRSIHVRIVPRPANLSESREIYRVLQKFGDMDVFKYLRYEYQNPADNSALAIYRDEISAQRALDASPLRFALETYIPSPAESRKPLPSEQDAEHQPANQTPPNHGIDEVLRPSQLAARTLRPTPSPPPPKPTPMPFESSSSSAKAEKQSKWFQVSLDRSRAVHQDYVERQPFWKQFSPMKSMAQEDLAKTVPHAGLSDVSKRPPNAHRTPVRVLNIMNEYVENRMPTLRGIAENHESELRFEERMKNRE